MNENQITKNKRIRLLLGFGILALGLLISLMLNVGIGTVQVSATDIFQILFGQHRNEVTGQIIWEIRMPRAIAAMLLGGGLALSGYMLQTFFHNPIAGPFVLGISSGAKMVVALAFVFFVGFGLRISSFGLIGAAFLGAMLSMGFVLILSRAVKNMSMLIVAGVMIGYICSAITDFVITFADDSNIVNLHTWSLGSFSGITWENDAVIAIVILTVLVVTFFISKPMSAYQLGEEYAKNLGVPISLFRCGLVILSSLLSACVTAFAGPISFVGIAVPHIVKNLFHTTKPIIMIPACFLGGGIFCLVCDLLSRILFAPTEISVSSITAIFGAPIVLVIMIKSKKNADR